MYRFYPLFWLLGLPLAFLHLLWRARRQPEYLRHWPERLGFAPRISGPVIWLHAVSVGETRAAAPLLTALAQACPQARILLTHTTPTGRATSQELFGDRVLRCYLPYDFPPLVALFLRRSRPQLALFMETEIWPSVYAACAQRGIPLYLVNARLSEKSARGYSRLPKLTRIALTHVTAVAAQTNADAERLVQLGATQVSVTGNLKFDVSAPPDTTAKTAELRKIWGNRFVLLAASTREGEEALILDACANLSVMLVIVPRHPQRFDTVAAEIASRGLLCVRRSEGHPVDTGTRVFLGDSMGEMAAYYAACDLAFIGGSLKPLGGQNLIEAAAAGAPILIGPHTFNFAESAHAAVACGAAERISDATGLARRASELFNDPEKLATMSAAGLAFTAAHRGATARVMALLEPAIATVCPPQPNHPASAGRQPLPASDAPATNRTSPHPDLSGH